MEHIFHSKRPRWAWPAAVVCFGLAALAGAVFGWWAALGPAVAGASVLGEASGPIVLERDETGAARWIRSRGVAVDLARLAALKFVQGGYSLRDADGGHILVPLDERLRHEAAAAAYAGRLQLDAVTEQALLERRQGTLSSGVALSVAASAVFVPAVLVAFSLYRTGGFELDRDHAVTASALVRGSETPGSVSNPFLFRSEDLYVLGHGRELHERVPRLAATLQGSFGLRAGLSGPLNLARGVLDSSRQQLDGAAIDLQLMETFIATEPTRPAIVIALTDLDMFDSSKGDSRFEYVVTQWMPSEGICVNMISTARLDVWPGSEARRLEKLAGLALRRCLGFDEPLSVTSVRDIDRLDERAGADAQTIAAHVAQWRERFRLPKAS